MTEIIIKTWPNGQTSLALAALRFCLGDDPVLRLSHPSPTTPSPAGGSDLGLSPGQVPGQRYLVEYAPFAQTAVARFEQALAQGTVTDDAAGFARFASEDFTPYTAFLNHWVRSDFVRDQIVLNLADLYDYMTRRLLQGSVRNDPAMLDEVRGLLLELKSAWDEIIARGGA